MIRFGPSGNCKRLKHWFSICPKDMYTTLDTHDGIGTVDVEDLLTEEELQNVICQTEKYGANFKMDFSAKAKDKPVVYQINCTYYSALGEDDQAYLLSRAIQFFAPGIPQVYYMGLLAGENDYELMRRTDFPRNISRHNYDAGEIEEAVKKPVVQKLCKLMRLRNEFPAFDGEVAVSDLPDHLLEITRESNGVKAVLWADLATKEFKIRCSGLDNGNDYDWD